MPRSASPSLLALKQAGLDYLLFDEETARALRAAARPQPAPKQSPPARPPAPKTTQRPAPHGPASQAARPPAPRPPAAPALEAWPARWRERLDKTRPAPVLWVYWELGRDLLGPPEVKRRECVQGLLRELSHPPGTHSFWPPALPDADGNEAAAPALFWEGARMLRGRVALVFGSKALEGIDPPPRLSGAGPFRQFRHRGLLLVTLPDLEDIARKTRPGEPVGGTALREFLRATLAPFA